MKMTKREFNTTLLVAATAAFGRSAAMAQTVQQSASGSTKSSSQDLAFRAFRPSPAKSWDEQLVYQRGIEAVIWAMPAVSMAFFRDSAFKAYGITYHNIIAFSHPAQPRHELLTSNAHLTPIDECKVASKAPHFPTSPIFGYLKRLFRFPKTKSSCCECRDFACQGVDRAAYALGQMVRCRPDQRDVRHDGACGWEHFHEFTGPKPVTY